MNSCPYDKNSSHSPADGCTRIETVRTALKVNGVAERAFKAQIQIQSRGDRSLLAVGINRAAIKRSLSNFSPYDLTVFVIEERIERSKSIFMRITFLFNKLHDLFRVIGTRK